MKRSFRRIGNALIVVSIIGLSISFISSLSLQCGDDSGGCLANVFWGVRSVATPLSDVTILQTTPQISVENTGWIPFLQYVSAYAMLTAVGILIVLEFVELYYIKKIIQYRRHFKTKFI